MLQQPVIDPVALQLGPLAIHWYGLTYLAAFGLFYFLGTRRLTHQPFASLPQWTRKDIEDILFLGVLGSIVLRRFGAPVARGVDVISGTIMLIVASVFAVEVVHLLR